MAQLVSLIGSSHYPWYHARTSVPESDLTQEGRDFLQRSAMIQEALQIADPEALVVIGSDHFHQFFPSNMPSFLVGRMEGYQGTFANEVREFGLPRCRVPGNQRLSDELIQGLFSQGIDPSFSDELRLDHSVIVPLMIANPSFDIPVVPVMSNCGAPPLPPPERFVQLGRALAAAITESDAVERVAVIVSGNLSLEVGGPEQMLPRPSDPDFDVAAMAWIQDKDVDRLVRESSFEKMMSHGNTTFQFLNYLSLVGIAESGMRCTYADAMARQGSNQAFSIWEPEGDR